MSEPITPTSLAELERILEIRNRGCIEEAVRRLQFVKNLDSLKIRLRHVLDELKRVLEDEPEAEAGVRDFLGGAGLITRRGFVDTITDAGLSIIGRRAAAA